MVDSKQRQADWEHCIMSFNKGVSFGIGWMDDWVARDHDGWSVTANNT